VKQDLKAFKLSTTPSIQDASHDILQALHHEIAKSPIKWKGVHIKGHQDDNLQFEKLNRPSQLNVLADHMAKDLLSIAIQR
jgi:hypothetical protein